MHVLVVSLCLVYLCVVFRLFALRSCFTFFAGRKLGRFPQCHAPPIARKLWFIMALSIAVLFSTIARRIFYIQTYLLFSSGFITIRVQSFHVEETYRLLRASMLTGSPCCITVYKRKTPARSAISCAVARNHAFLSYYCFAFRRSCSGAPSCWPQAVSASTMMSRSKVNSWIKSWQMFCSVMGAILKSRADNLQLTGWVSYQWRSGGIGACLQAISRAEDSFRVLLSNYDVRLKAEIPGHRPHCLDTAPWQLVFGLRRDSRSGCERSWV